MLQLGATSKLSFGDCFVLETYAGGGRWDLLESDWKVFGVYIKSFGSVSVFWNGTSRTNSKVLTTSRTNARRGWRKR